MSSFGQDFVAQYGWPDNRQTWKTAVQYKISINADFEGVWNLRVYSANPTLNPTKSYLLGNFDVNLSEGNGIVFCDAPYTLRTIYIGIEDGDVFATKNVAIKEDGNIEVSFVEADFTTGTLPSATKMSYFIAYEIVDSAATYLDYNDIVLEIAHVSGEETADVKLRAVGAKEEMKISFKNEDKETVLYKDAHYAFGYHNPNFLINVETGDHKYRTPIKYNNLNVGKDFSMVKDGHRFVVSVPQKKKTIEFALWPDIEQYLGLPPYAILVACPIWDWASENGKIDERLGAFPYWIRSFRIYNQWWDALWDPRELVLFKDGSYQPDYDYDKMVFGKSEIEKNNGIVPEIDWRTLESCMNGKYGIDFGFSIIGRNKGRIKISLIRSDNGEFERYPIDEDGICRAYIEVFGDKMNVDAGIGNNAESCHIFITQKTAQQIINSRSTVRVIVDAGETETQINSVWIRER